MNLEELKQFVELTEKLVEGMKAYQTLWESGNDEKIRLGEFIGILVRDKDEEDGTEKFELLPWDYMTMAIGAESHNMDIFVKQTEAGQHEEENE